MVPLLNFSPSSLFPPPIYPRPPGRDHRPSFPPTRSCTRLSRRRRPTNFQCTFLPSFLRALLSPYVAPSKGNRRLGSATAQLNRPSEKRRGGRMVFLLLLLLLSVLTGDRRGRYNKAPFPPPFPFPPFLFLLRSHHGPRYLMPPFFFSSPPTCMRLAGGDCRRRLYVSMWRRGREDYGRGRRNGLREGEKGGEKPFLLLPNDRALINKNCRLRSRGGETPRGWARRSDTGGDGPT